MQASVCVFIIDSRCRFKISIDYIKKSFNSFKKGFIYKENDTNIGFVIWKEKQIIPKSLTSTITKKVLYVLLICSNMKNTRLTRVIFNDLEEYSKANSIDYIQLVPANEKLQQLYSVYGFTLSDPINMVMTKEVNNMTIFINRTRKNKHYKNMSKGNKYYNNYKLHKKYKINYNNNRNINNTDTDNNNIINVNNISNTIEENTV